MSQWQRMAAEAIENGYQPGNSWERSLKRHLERLFPELVKELGSDLESYLQVQTHDAMDLATRLEDEGTPPQMARELAMQRLYPTPEDEIPQTEQWEMDAQNAALNEAAMQALTGEKAPPREVQAPNP